MALINDVKTVCDRLAPRGWRDLLLRLTDQELDIQQASATELQAVLTRPLNTIDRTGGLADFDRYGRQAVTGGQPSRSLLYHTLASPSVHPTADGSPTDRDHYPTLSELDVLENFIYSLVSDRTDLDDTFVAVFAYQYRVGSRTSHFRHADLAYSRTGVGRVGTADCHYDPSRRGFWVVPQTGGDALCVLPARYGAFLARRAKPGGDGSVQGGHDGLADDDYVFPVHKLFAGDECLKGRTLGLDFLEYHRNEKLRMAHRLPQSRDGLPLPPGFDISKHPYVRDSNNGGNLATLQHAGASVLVVPTAQPTLVRTVSQYNAATGKEQIVHFVVPRSRRITTSTLMIPDDGGDRLAPEYVNIRQEVDPAGAPDQRPTDLNSLSASDFARTMREGDYPAAHFTDDSCDGCVEAVVTGLATDTENLPAFSLITAPDFFPLADQMEVEQDLSIRRVRPLSKGRLPANPNLMRPSDPTRYAFDVRETTVTAIVGAAASGPAVDIIGQSNRTISSLPDSASDVYAPGWDTTRSRDQIGSFLTTSGLGSPFPEDAKLCAAIASFWPAVAPDNGRTFGNDDSADISMGNQLPMLDQELGFHARHQRVKAGQVVSYRGWDGEYGPFYETAEGKTYVNYVDIERSDYVAHALAGRIHVSLTAEIQSEDLLARHRALVACQRLIGTRMCLVSFRAVEDWTAFRGGPSPLVDGGYRLDFADLGHVRGATDEVERLHREVRERHVFHVAENGLLYDKNETGFVFYPS